MASIEDKVAGSLYAMFSADSLAFPSHWYYNAEVLKEHKDKYYNGSLDKFYSVPDEIRAAHPNSGSFTKSAFEKGGAPIAEITKEENKPLWQTQKIHWNGTLKAGQNTNTVQLAKALIDSLVANNGEYRREDYVERYIKYFKKHEYDDMYFEGIHQGFFKQLAAGKGPFEAGKEGEKCLSGHTLPIPLTLLLHKNRDEAQKAVRDHLYLTHRSDEMVSINSHLTDLIIDLLEGNGDAKTLIGETAKKIRPGIDLAAILAGAKGNDDAELFTEEITKSKFLLAIRTEEKHNDNANASGEDSTKAGFAEFVAAAEAAREKERAEAEISAEDLAKSKFSIDCYHATPGALYLACKYFDDPKQALIVNANLGGDNTHRGSLLGAILGAAHGTEWIPTEWRDGLNDSRRPDLPGYINKFANLAKESSNL